MNRGPKVRLAALALLLALFWVWAGAPLTQTEWQDVPARLARNLRQLPARTLPVWRQWLAVRSSRNDAGETLPSSALSLRVWDAEEQAVALLPLEEYVCGAVAAEMPVSYGLEALKSQAVAARTRAVWSCRSLGGRGCAAHPTCDVCTDSACCQGWCSEETQLAKWGSAYEEYARRVRQAVRATCGEILTWDGLPAQVLYHACAGGRTEDAAAVFAARVPYLTSVDSPGEENSSVYRSEVTLAREEAAERLLDAFPDSGVTAADLPGQLELRSTTASGRVDRMLVGRVETTGREVRAALGLGSALFTWDADEDSITFHVRGSGHGVGMSQAGAQAMAASGSDHASILAHYYPGTVLAHLPDDV